MLLCSPNVGSVCTRCLFVYMCGSVRGSVGSDELACEGKRRTDGSGVKMAARGWLRASRAYARSVREVLARPSNEYTDRKSVV